MDRRSFLSTSFGAFAAISLVRPGLSSVLVPRPKAIHQNGVVLALFDSDYNEVCGRGYTRVQTFAEDWKGDFNEHFRLNGTIMDSRSLPRSTIRNVATFQFGPAKDIWRDVAAMRLYRNGDIAFKTVDFDSVCDVTVGTTVAFYPGDVELWLSIQRPEILP